MKLLQILILPLVFLSYSCKKKVIENSCENNIDSVLTYIDEFADESSPYLAAYPGSWWEFSTGDTVTCIENELLLFKLENEDKEKCQSFYTVFRFYGPAMGGDENPYFTAGTIDGDYNISINTVGVEFSKHKEIIRTDYIDNAITDSWVVTADNGSNYSRSTTRKLNQLHSSFSLPNGETYQDVAEIIENFNYTDSTTMYTYNDSVLLYYSKEIGLIMIDFFEATISEIYLTDYYIAPH